MKALLIVDLQNDFCPGGALGVKDGHKIVPVINELARQFELVIASRDWHPEETVHFEKWPVHCVANTEGAAFHPGLSLRPVQQVFDKGTTNADDGYSAFEATNLDLAAYLKERKVDEIYLCGLTTEYCVKSTAFDALRAGFKTFLYTDAIAPVNLTPGDAEKALNDMQDAGVIFLTSKISLR
ncbi:nicotinamidase/pyrazinamidase [Cyclonatronum proteinivorum]|uniref:nicotinamidase n=1 Tax=Cyclonatronum proteinivorum TaxID=1457365 RepID=A0A345UKT8_9BACT|nr:nicotinamidase [Cyclonatronum proteinivorum]AXJ01090.1 nicotinamidase/pyrazinamidase [Cyclonatronum proteinivorum]